MCSLIVVKRPGEASQTLVVDSAARHMAQEARQEYEELIPYLPYSAALTRNLVGSASHFRMGLRGHGAQIAFYTNRAGVNTLYTMNADGCDPHPAP